MAGDTFSEEVSVDDIVVSTQEFHLFAANAQGQLVTDGTALPNSPLIPLRTSSPQVNASKALLQAAPPTSVADLQIFFKALWDALGRQYQTTDATRLLQEIGDLEHTVEQLYALYQASGLTLAEFVDFYEAIDEFPYVDSESAESDVSHLLSMLQLNHQQLVTALSAANSSWRGLLTVLNTRQHSLEHLLNAYLQSGLPPEAFFSQYLQTPLLKTALAEGKDDKDDKDGKGGSGIDVAKFIWQIIKDNKPNTEANGAFTRILSQRDDNWERYASATKGSSKSVKVKAQNAFKMTIYRTEFALSGYYNAKHPDFEGAWLPMLMIDVKDMYAMFSWTLNAKGAITVPVNVGTVEAPIPELTTTMELNQKGVFQNYLNKYSFIANGATGFSR